MSLATEATVARWPGDFQRVRDFYQSRFLQPLPYSDGDAVEQAMLDDLRATKDRSLFSPEVAALIRDWPTLYHFSPQRANLLRPIEFGPNARILEIGAGCGAVTRYLGESALNVTAVEGSPRRAEIAATRTADLPNVTVIAGNHQEVIFDEPFDHIVVVGVLEYAAMFSDSSTCFTDFLDSLKGNLAPHGTLFLAIENRLGLKYFAGMPEDHTGRPFQGVSDAYALRGPRTFSRGELQELLRMSGFAHSRFLCPYPDYKLPCSVADLSATPREYLESVAQMAAADTEEDRQIRRMPTFSLETAMAAVIRDGIGENLSNSFLVVAGSDFDEVKKATAEGIFAWHYATGRGAAFRKETQLKVDGAMAFSIPTPIAPSEVAPASDAVSQRLDVTEVRRGASCWLTFGQSVNREGWLPAEAAESLSPWFRALCQEYSNLSDSQRGMLADATPFNAFESPSGDVLFFDLEWHSQRPTRLEWIVLRGVFFALSKLTSVARPGFDAGLPRLQVALMIVRELFEEVPEPSVLDLVPFLHWLTEFQAACRGVAMPDFASASRGWLSLTMQYR